MERFERIESITVPFPRANVDTDQILPARFLQKPRGGGFGQYLFHDLRFHPDGSERQDFVLNQPQYQGARILIAGANFGCGSSRENAVWALYDSGFRVIVALSFGDIFFNNCLKNGLLPIALPWDSPATHLTVDLESQTVAAPGEPATAFDVDPFAKHCLLNGLDELDYTLSRMGEIRAFEANYKQL